MTGPHVFGASSQQTPYTAYYTTPQHSPFIPPTDIGNYPPSPYRSVSPLPNAELPPNTVQFPISYDATSYPYGPPVQYPYRPRAPSYHGPPLNPYVAPAFPPQASPWSRPQRLSNPMYPGVVPDTPYAFPGAGGSPLPGIYPDLPGSFALHPFLNGETPRLDFAFNLSAQFAPMQLVQGQPVPISHDILSQPATHPPVFRLKIVCDEIPEWPITLELDSNSYLEQTGTMLLYPPPISLVDMLSQIHRTLHERITHGDWARLDERKKYKVTQAYTARCATAPTMEQLLKNDGVKKVDYLLDKVWFRGLVRSGQGNEVLKLVVSRR